MGETVPSIVLAKIFNRQGCIAYRCKTPDEVRSLPGTLEAIRADDVQIVLMTGPDIYSEYAPYRYMDNLWEFICAVRKLNRNLYV